MAVVGRVEVFHPYFTTIALTLLYSSKFTLVRVGIAVQTANNPLPFLSRKFETVIQKFHFLSDWIQSSVSIWRYVFLFYVE